MPSKRWRKWARFSAEGQGHPCHYMQGEQHYCQTSVWVCSFMGSCEPNGWENKNVDSLQMRTKHRYSLLSGWNGNSLISPVSLYTSNNQLENVTSKMVNSIHAFITIKYLKPTKMTPKHFVYLLFFFKV